ncbi:MAG: hypothetical protein QOE45_1492 [Frankiaceae bacterium]|jgi:hypothetical protein|nr:hypothetical protein [Frankiaceae bacterium]
MTAYVLAAAVLPTDPAPPPGVDPAAYRAALLADAFDVLDDLAGVTAYVATEPTPYAALAALHRTGATIGAVIAGDAPDLPGLLVGKLYGACEDRAAGVLPARDGGLVGLASRLPPPDWLAGITLDSDLDDVHAAAPANAVVVGPGWHRLRKPADVSRLDPRLDGWYATRALLSPRRP